MPLLPLAAAEKQHLNAAAALLREGRTLLAAAPRRCLEFDRLLSLTWFPCVLAALPSWRWQAEGFR